jgi:hypothetical protein
MLGHAKLPVKDIRWVKEWIQSYKAKYNGYKQTCCGFPPGAGKFGEGVRANDDDTYDKGNLFKWAPFEHVCL